MRSNLVTARELLLDVLGQESASVNRAGNDVHFQPWRLKTKIRLTELSGGRVKLAASTKLMTEIKNLTDAEIYTNTLRAGYTLALSQREPTLYIILSVILQFENEQLLEGHDLMLRHFALNVMTSNVEEDRCVESLAAFLKGRPPAHRRQEPTKDFWLLEAIRDANRLGGLNLGFTPEFEKTLCQRVGDIYGYPDFKADPDDNSHEEFQLSFYGDVGQAEQPWVTFHSQQIHCQNLRCGGFGIFFGSVRDQVTRYLPHELTSLRWVAFESAERSLMGHWTDAGGAVAVYMVEVNATLLQILGFDDESSVSRHIEKFLLPIMLEAAKISILSANLKVGKVKQGSTRRQKVLDFQKTQSGLSYQLPEPLARLTAEKQSALDGLFGEEEKRLASIFLDSNAGVTKAILSLLRRDNGTSWSIVLRTQTAKSVTENLVYTNGNKKNVLSEGIRVAIESIAGVSQLEYSVEREDGLSGMTELALGKIAKTVNGSPGGKKNLSISDLALPVEPISLRELWERDVDPARTLSKYRLTYVPKGLGTPDSKRGFSLVQRPN